MLDKIDIILSKYVEEDWENILVIRKMSEEVWKEAKLELLEEMYEEDEIITSVYKVNKKQINS